MVVLWSFSAAFQRVRLSVPRPANQKSKIKNPPAAWDTLGTALGRPMGRSKSPMFPGLGTVVRLIYPPARRKELQPLACPLSSVRMLGGSPKTPKQPRHRVLPFPPGANRESFGKFAAQLFSSNRSLLFFCASLPQYRGPVFPLVLWSWLIDQIR